MINVVLAEEKAPDLVKAISGIDLGGGFSINNIFGWAIGIGGIAALGIIIFGGILYIASAGNSSKQEDAKDWIKAAVYGLLLLAAGYLILNTVNPRILQSIST
ncbi:MAG: hypothetical protein HYR95_00810 [Candidatus Colwellbacteria bacterium]|nr:hypothetical protein [Candidatus Colwellbacteria bacterium]MBI3273825.1 hypothetical protein [Candidatus Colwellbacteria bacterium]